jgi:polygalacturonase
MKKVIVFLLALVLLTGLVSCASGSKDESAESSETAMSAASEETQSAVSDESYKSEETKTNNGEAINTVEVYNVCDYGAKHNGLDDSACIQAAIDACSVAGGGTVYLPAGTYTVCQTLYNKANVSIKGDGMWSVKLLWKGPKGSAVIDTSNEALWGVSIENLFKHLRC